MATLERRNGPGMRRHWPTGRLHKRANAQPALSRPGITDELWAQLAPLITKLDPPARVGRHRVDERAVLDAILYRLAVGCAWNQLPPGLPHTSSVYRTYRRWLDSGLLDQLLNQIVAHQTQRGRGWGATSGRSAV